MSLILGARGVSCCLDVARAASLRRPLGGRLRLYDARSETRAERLEAIRKALLRGELAVNAFNRWCISTTRAAGVHWTFAAAGRTTETVERELAIARRETGHLSVAVADEASARDWMQRIDSGADRPELLFVQRDWTSVPTGSEPVWQLIRVARRHSVLVHVAAAFGLHPPSRDDLFHEARRRWRLLREPLAGPDVRTSSVERRLGQCLKAAGLNPVPQLPVAHYFLDFAVVGDTAGLPVRLDVEVDGPHWHEDVPGRLREADQTRNRVMRRLGWRPVRFWAHEVDKDEESCVDRVRSELATPTVRPFE